MACTDISELIYVLPIISYITLPKSFSGRMLTLAVVCQWLMRYEISSFPLSPLFRCRQFRTQLNYTSLYLSEKLCFKNFNEEHSCAILCQHVWPLRGQRKMATIWVASIGQWLSFRLVSWLVKEQKSSRTKRKLFSEEANDKLMCTKPTVRYQMADGQIGKLACKMKTVLFPQELLDTRSVLKQKWMYNYSFGRQTDEVRAWMDQYPGAKWFPPGAFN